MFKSYLYHCPVCMSSLHVYYAYTHFAMYLCIYSFLLSIVLSVYLHLVCVLRWRKNYKLRKHLRRSMANFPPMGPLTPLHVQMNSMLPASERRGITLSLVANTRYMYTAHIHVHVPVASMVLIILVLAY